MMHELVAEVDLGAGSWAEVLVGSDDLFRILVHVPDEVADEVEWSITTLYGPFALIEQVNDRLQALAARNAEAN